MALGERAAAERDWGELFSAFGRIGLLSFGGPAGQIALMHRVLVDERRWLSEERFLHALNFCMLLPGPEAMQLATYSGWLLRGVAGGILAGLLFVLPGFCVVLGLSILYVTLGDVPLVAGLLLGLKAAVLAIVAEALARVSRKGLRGRWQAVVAISAFVAIALFGVPFPLVILAAALIGLAFARPVRREAPPVPISHVHVARTLTVWLAIWLLPVAATVMLVGSVWGREALFFSQAAVVTFGGAYAVLAYVAQRAVEDFGWLAPGEMATGLGLAESTPGPLILVLVFVGFMGGHGVDGSLWGGAFGALITAWVTFAPCFLWIFLGAPYVERLDAGGRASSALAGVTAAVVGVIANLAVWFALQVLFGTVGETVHGPLTVWTPDPATFQWRPFLIAGVAAFMLWRHVDVLWTLAVAALLGIALQWT